MNTAGRPWRPGMWSLFGLLVLAGCSSTRIADTWQAPTFKRSDLDRVLIVAISADMTNRILFERSFAAEMRREGLDAVASYEVLGSQAPARERVVEYLAQQVIPHLMVVQYGSASVSQVVAPDTDPQGVGEGSASTYGGFWDRQDYIETVGQGGSVDYTQRLILTTTLFERESQRPVWRARSNSFEVSSIEAVADRLARVVLKRIGD